MKIILKLIWLILLACFFFLTSYKNRQKKIENTEKATVLESQTTTVPSHLKWVGQEIDNMLTINNIPGFAIGVIEDGKISWANNGYEEMERKIGIPLSAASDCQIASLTKRFTGILVKELKIEAKFNPQESITTYLDDVLNKEANERLKGVTVELILHHRSGILGHASSVNRIDGDPKLIAYTQDDMNKDLNTIELDFEPNSKWSYSNYVYYILG